MLTDTGAVPASTRAEIDMPALSTTSSLETKTMSTTSVAGNRGAQDTLASAVRARIMLDRVFALLESIFSVWLWKSPRDATKMPCR